MHPIKRNLLSCSAMAAMVAVTLMTVSAPARAAGDPITDGKAHTTLRIYGWLPSVSGSTRFDYPSGGDVSMNQRDVLDALNMTFMGSAEYRKGRWAAFTDLIYLDMGASADKGVNLPPALGQGLSANLRSDLRGWVWTAGASYTMWHQGKSNLDALAGVRLFSASLDNSLSVTGPLGGTTSLDLNTKLTLWDGLVGVRGRASLGGPWFLPYYLDVGTGDSRLTSNGYAGIGYEFDWGELTLTYRYMYYDQGSDKTLQSVSFQGLAAGANFRF